MSLFVHISGQCLEDAKRHSLEEIIEKFKQKVINDQNLLRFERFPAPFLKKKFGNSYRLIASYHECEEDILVHFLRVLPRGDAEYSHFIKNPDQTVQSLMLDESSVSGILDDFKISSFVYSKIIPTDIQNLYLYDVFSQQESTLEDDFVLESKTWLEMAQDPEIRLELRSVCRAISEAISNKAIYSGVTEYYDSGDKRFGFIGRYFSESKLFFLIAPIFRKKITDEEKQKLIRNYSAILTEAESEKIIDSCKRRSIRTYPMYFLLDDELWLKIQKDSKDASSSANLALSPEELGVLQSVKYSEKEKSFPLFINGRPGSGKSTLLQYIYSEYLHFYNKHVEDKKSYTAPIYLTYSEDLKQDAVKQITNIITKHHSKLLDDNTISTIPAYCFDEFILEVAVKGTEFQDCFHPSKRITYKEFRPLCEKYIKSNVALRSLSPGLVWHTIRTYIKGMSNGDEFLSPVDYKTIPEKRKTVSDGTYKLIYENVFEPWYLRQLMNEEGYWDHQDLTRIALEHELIFVRYPAIFCDESQDFTRIELELIYRLSDFSSVSLTHQEMQRVPLVFAGDPFQTLNPTGFKWETVKDLFNETILASLDPTSKGRLEFNYWPLTYNYRSSGFIVNFCNYILLCRSILFNEREVKAQQTWGENSPDYAQYLNLNEAWVKDKLLEQHNITYIVPCDEGSEIEFAKQDSFLSQFIDNDVSRVNILSPIRAKGLQYPRVVLYKFSEYAPTTLKDDMLSTDTTQAGLEDEYFLNKLYVSASRPQKQLFVVESTEYEKNSFWSFARRTDFDEIIAENNVKISNWTDSDGVLLLSHLAKASIRHQSIFDIDKEDPEETAQQLFDDGLKNHDPQMLRTAKRQFLQTAMLQRNTKANTCEAYAFLYEEKYQQAGETFLSIGLYREAVNALWKGGVYSLISRIDDDQIEIDLRLYKAVAKFMEEPKDYSACMMLIEQLVTQISASEKLKLDVLYDDRWYKVFATLTQTIANLEDKSIDWDLIQKHMIALRPLVGRLPHKELGTIFYKAGAEESAYNEWCKITNFNDPRLIRLKTKYGRFADKLDAHFKLEEYEQVYELFVANPLEEKSSAVLNLVNLSLVKLNDIKTELAFKKEYRRSFLPDEPNSYISELIALFEKGIAKKAEKGILKDIVLEYLDYTCTNFEWKAALSLLKNDLKKRRVFSHLDLEHYENRILYYALNATEFVSGIVKEKELKENLDTFLKESKFYKEAIDGNYEKFLIVGAIIENLENIMPAIRFYEEFWKNDDKYRRINEESAIQIITHAKVRWIAAKKRLHRYSEKSDSQKQQENDSRRAGGKKTHEQDAKDRHEQWRIRIEYDRIEEYFKPDYSVVEKHLLSHPNEKHIDGVKIPKAPRQNDPIFTNTKSATNSGPIGTDIKTGIEPKVGKISPPKPTKSVAETRAPIDCTISAEIEEYKYRIDFLKARKQLMVSVKSDGFTKTYDLNDTAGWKEINTGTKRFAEEEIKLLLEIEGKYLSLRYMENEQELCSFKLEE